MSRFIKIGEAAKLLGISIQTLNLASRAREIFESFEVSEKRQFLNLVFQNLQLRDASFQYQCKNLFKQWWTTKSVHPIGGGETHSELLIGAESKSQAYSILLIERRGLVNRKLVVLPGDGTSTLEKQRGVRSLNRSGTCPYL